MRPLRRLHAPIPRPAPSPSLRKMADKGDGSVLDQALEASDAGSPARDPHTPPEGAAARTVRVGVCAMECLLLLSSGESQRSITSTFLGVLLSVIKPAGEGASLILPSALVALRMLNRRSMVFLFAPTSLAV